MSCIISAIAVVKVGTDGKTYSIAANVEYQVPDQIPQDIADSLIADGCAIECSAGDAADPAVLQCLADIKLLLEEDKTDDDERPVAVQCYAWETAGGVTGEFMGYGVTDEMGGFLRWVVVQGVAAPAGALIECKPLVLQALGAQPNTLTGQNP